MNYEYTLFTNGTILLEKALSFAKQLNIEKFQSSDGRLHMLGKLHIIFRSRKYQGSQDQSLLKLQMHGMKHLYL